MNACAATIHVIDDETQVRKALTRLLESAGFAVKSYESAGEFLRETLRDEPGCVLLDLALPGGLDGLQAQLAFQHGHDPLPIVFLTGRGSVAASVRAMKAGAIDFLEKPVEDSLLLDAVRRAIAFDADQRARRTRDRLLSTRFASLTPREREVFRHVVAGRLNKQIAYDIGTCERTVKAHRARVMEKLHVRSVAELVHVADELEASILAIRQPPIAQAARRELVS